MILGPVDQMQVAHGPRDSDGGVQVAWVPKAGLARLAQLPLKLRGLYPAPYALPVGAAALDEGYLLTRDSLQQGAVHPLGLQALDVPLVEATQRWGGPVPAWDCTVASTNPRPADGAGRWPVWRWPRPSGPLASTSTRPARWRKASDSRHR